MPTADRDPILEMARREWTKGMTPVQAAAFWEADRDFGLDDVAHECERAARFGREVAARALEHAGQEIAGSFGNDLGLGLKAADLRAGKGGEWVADKLTPEKLDALLEEGAKLRSTLAPPPQITSDDMKKRLRDAD